MAEALSAIATLTTLSLAIIQKTVKFIQETRKVDDLVKKLSDALEDLKSLIEDVQQTCTHVKPTEDDSSQRVKEALDRCVRRLEGVKSLVEDLASRKSGTFIQKASLKIRSDRSKADIQEAIEDIKLLMTQIHQRAGFWSLRIISNVDRRLSEAIPLQQIVNPVQIETRNVTEDEVTSPLTRRLSDAETVFEDDSIFPPRSSSTTTHTSQTTASSESVESRRPGSQGRRSTTRRPEPVKENSDWVDFHYQIKVCENNEAHVQAIKMALQQHPQGAVLANSVDGSRRSPLHLAAQRGNVELARILLDFSANINAKDSQPSSVLDLAIQHNNEDFVAFLLDRGADETAISKFNRDRFEEMKDTIELRKDKARKSEKKNLKRRRTGTNV